MSSLISQTDPDGYISSIITCLGQVENHKFIYVRKSRVCCQKQKIKLNFFFIYSDKKRHTLANRITYYSVEYKVMLFATLIINIIDKQIIYIYDAQNCNWILHR